MVSINRTLVGGAVFFGVAGGTGRYVFEIRVLVADFGGVARTIDQEFLAEVEIGPIENEADDRADNANEREKDGANLKIAEEDEWLDNDVPSGSENEHASGLDGEKARGDEEDCGAEGEQPRGSTEISPRRLHCGFLSGVR